LVENKVGLKDYDIALLICADRDFADPSDDLAIRAIVRVVLLAFLHDSQTLPQEHRRS
jgi:hypothetical protein